jgi:hypothetical protein
MVGRIRDDIEIGQIWAGYGRIYKVIDMNERFVLLKNVVTGRKKRPILKKSLHINYRNISHIF